MVLMPHEGDLFMAHFGYCRIGTRESAAAALQYHTSLNTASRVGVWVGFPQPYVDAWILNLSLTYTMSSPTRQIFILPSTNDTEQQQTSLIHVQSTGLEGGE